MIKEALQYVVGMGKAELHQIDGQEYSDKQLHLIEEPTAREIELNSLSGMVEYLKSKFDTNDALMVHVVSPTRVVAFNSLNSNMNRDRFVEATAMIPDFSFDRWYDTEQFNIKLQSCFVAGDDKDIILKVVGNIKESQVRTTGDDGVSQMVTAKVGVASVSDVVVPNPVSLRPFRTFVEVKQPESEFVFRMKDGPSCALFEADGGAWKLMAMQNIKIYLEEALEIEIKSGKVIVIA